MTPLQFPHHLHIYGNQVFMYVCITNPPLAGPKISTPKHLNCPALYNCSAYSAMIAFPISRKLSLL